MRVITGTAKGKRLVTPEGKEITRPTGDKVKEGIFSSIQFILEGADVLDLFAGSGQLGIEALSRGAKTAVFVDKAKEAQKCISENIKNCGFADRSRVKTMDALLYLSGAMERFDIAFLDRSASRSVKGDAPGRNGVLRNRQKYRPSGNCGGAC